MPLKASWTGLICRTYQHYTASDCQTPSGQIPGDEPHSARYEWLWRETLKRGSLGFKTRVELFCHGYRRKEKKSDAEFCVFVTVPEVSSDSSLTAEKCWWRRRPCEDGLQCTRRVKVGQNEVRRVMSTYTSRHRQSLTYDVQRRPGAD